MATTVKNSIDRLRNGNYLADVRNQIPCFQGNVRQMCIFLLTAKWNIKVKYQLKSQRGMISSKTQIFISWIKQELFSPGIPSNNGEIQQVT